MSDLLSKDKELYQQEETQLLKAILDTRFFVPWSFDVCDKFSLKNDANLELFLTNACNQKCEYCYLVQYPDLYPKEFTSPELILKNLRIIYDWIIKNEYSIPKVEFFTGEIWHTQFGWDVLDLTLEYLQKGMKTPFYLVASNFSFIFDDVARAKIHTYINKFEQYGSGLVFSCSVDGGVIEKDARPVNNGQVRDDTYWNNLFEFCKLHHFYFHPMVSATNVKYQIENHKWWKEQCAKWDLPINTWMSYLEVRNDNWTTENIQDYCKFLDYLIDDNLASFNGDITKYASHVLHFRGDVLPIDPNKVINGYSLISLPSCDTFPGCTLATDLTVRVGDLALCPCHRTAYNKYLYGHLTLENDEIVGLEASNASIASKVLMSNVLLCNHGCDTCLFNTCCIHGCCGSQLEATGDPFFPIESVCNMLKAKYAHVLKRYEELGIIDYIRTITPYERDYADATKILMIYDEWVKEGKPYDVMASNK